ncbi:YbaB/EbfC family nucleoid-associated protein [Jidongwangia harbinensis]|uniref:YbaB/EbfC family nucleoid-associated protein n=1 Tax=Jidongwangia harbinensis TaxID=2878561 RepID=UPI001CD9D1A1|nr:YbaB/EbfC family nucleoid-associated protein [Jidongwangia harbinensis]MCA2217452.1 YbaB/EbfC family nucleoid-associated protein [Jidongwangia harbinensis]
MDFNERIEHLFQEYGRQRSSLTEMQQKMRDISVSATSPRREVTVTVGQSGVLTDVTFPTGAYKRLTPTELTALILQTYAEAKESALQRAAELLAPMLPDGMDAQALVRGTAGAETFLPPEPRMATSVREFLGIERAGR